MKASDISNGISLNQIPTYLGINCLVPTGTTFPVNATTLIPFRKIANSDTLVTRNFIETPQDGEFVFRKPGRYRFTVCLMVRRTGGGDTSGIVHVARNVNGTANTIARWTLPFDSANNIIFSFYDDLVISNALLGTSLGYSFITPNATFEPNNAGGGVNGLWASRMYVDYVGLN